jgi:hypothetical protein
VTAVLVFLAVFGVVCFLLWDQCEPSERPEFPST